MKAKPEKQQKRDNFLLSALSWPDWRKNRSAALLHSVYCLTPKWISTPVAKKASPQGCTWRLPSHCHTTSERLAFHSLPYGPNAMTFAPSSQIKEECCSRSSSDQTVIQPMLRYVMWVGDNLVPAQVLNLPGIHRKKIIWYENLWYYKLYLTFQGSFESAQLTELLKNTGQHILERGKTYRCVL